MIAEGYSIDAYCDHQGCKRACLGIFGYTKTEAWKAVKARGWTKVGNLVYCSDHKTDAKQMQQEAHI